MHESRSAFLMALVALLVPVGLAGEPAEPPPAQWIVFPCSEAGPAHGQRAPFVIGGVASERGAMASASDEVPTPYIIEPVAGIYDLDIWVDHFFDCDLSPGRLLDWACSGVTLDGHNAHDYRIRSFGQQDRGVPVVAALPGRVIAAIDGRFDKQTSWGGAANYVIIDHGDGQEAYYWHLKKDSVAVQTGDWVEAGQQIGQVGSSGSSRWPHLHFATRVNGVAVEPSTGPCNPGRSGWKKQKRISRKTKLLDLGFTHKCPPANKKWKNPPFALARSGQIGEDDNTLLLWFYILNPRQKTSYVVKAYRPNGSLGYRSERRDLLLDRPVRWVLLWDGIDMSHLRGHQGTWTVVLRFDGRKLVEAPVEVVRSRSKSWNRPPVQPSKLRFRPQRARASLPLACVVKVAPIVDDLDYDIVSYHFQWSVNGEVVREVISAARSDYLAARTGKQGDRVTCVVTPLDDQSVGEPIQKKTVFQ